MALNPFRTKFRKQQRGRIRGNATRGDTLAFGDFGIQTLDRAAISGQQIEAARVAINRYFNRRGKVWVRIFPQKPITKKPAETRQGKGKGNVEGWVACVKPGTVLFEVSGVTLTVAREAMRLADTKLPIHCRFISRENA
jgi:large subunit ribosomal protein L16